MNKRMVKIYYDLISNGKVDSINKLAESHAVSVRTIRNDISELNKKLRSINCEPILLEPYNTLSLSYHEGDVTRFDDTISFYEYSLSNEERLYIFTLILLLNNGFVTLITVAEVMNFSRTTTLKDFLELGQTLKTFGVQTFSRRASGIRLGESEEYNIRLLIIHYLKEDAFLIRLALRELLKLDLVDIRVKTLLGDELDFSKIVHEAEKKSGFFLTASARAQVKLYLLLAMTRISLGHSIRIPPSVKPPVKLALADALANNMSSYYKEFQLEGEYHCLTQLLLEVDYVRFGEVPPTEELIKLQWSVKLFISRVSRDIHFDLTNDFQVYNGISGYLAQSFTKNVGHFANAQRSEGLNTISLSSPLLIPALQRHLPIFEERSSYRLSEMDQTEILYFINSSILRMEKLYTNLKFLLICDRGEGLSAFLYERIKNKLNTNDLGVTISPLLDEYLLEETPDLIISTEIIGIRDIPIVNISTMLSDEDMDTIFNQMNKIKDHRYLLRKNPTIHPANYIRAREILLRQQPYGAAGEQDSGLLQRYLNNKYSFGNLLQWEYVETGVAVDDWQAAVLRSANILLKFGKITPHDIKITLALLEKDHRFVVIEKDIAVIPILTDYTAQPNEFNMSLIQLDTPISFSGSQEETVHYISCVKVVSGRHHLKAIHYLVSMLKDWPDNLNKY